MTLLANVAVVARRVARGSAGGLVPKLVETVRAEVVEDGIDLHVVIAVLPVATRLCPVLAVVLAEFVPLSDFVAHAGGGDGLAGWRGGRLEGYRDVGEIVVEGLW